MNKIVLIGRLTRDPDFHDGQSPYCRYTLAVDRRSKDKGADFINCVAFGRSAEFANSYFAKGTKIAVEGHLQTGSYEKDGVKINTVDVVIDSQEFCERKAAKTEDFVTIPDNAAGLPFN